MSKRLQPREFPVFPSPPSMGLIAAYHFPPLPGVMNPHEPGKDRSYICGDENQCHYCDCWVHDNPREYLGEKHEADCPIAAYVAELEVERTGQRSLFGDLE